MPFRTPPGSIPPRGRRPSSATAFSRPASSARRGEPLPGFGEDRETLERWRRFPGLERLPDGGRCACLTFDDGPDPDSTPAVLDALGAAGARATFFVLGEQLMRDPPFGGEIRRRGHEVALHGFAHVRHDDLTAREARDDLARGVGAIEAAAGSRPRWYRPPWGRLSEASFEASRWLGLAPVYWSSWGLDWESVRAERIAELVARDLGDGAIVLLHDSARYAPRSTAAATAEAVTLIAREAAERGLALRTLGEAWAAVSR